MNQSEKLSKIAVHSAANGLLFMTFFGALWASIGIVGAHGYGSPWLLIFCGIITLVFLIGAILLFGKGKSFSTSLKPEESEHWKKVNQKFVLVFMLEGIAIGIASFICNKLNHFEIFFPIMAIIVGVHFFPLAQLFRVYFYHITGAVLCILGIITFFLPTYATIGGISVVATSVFIGFGSAITLWATALTIWLTTLRHLKKKSE